MFDERNFLDDHYPRDDLRDRGVGLDERDSRDIVPLVALNARLDETLTRKLDSCERSDTEMQFGPSAWLDLENPFPVWRLVTDDPHENGEPNAG